MRRRKQASQSDESEGEPQAISSEEEADLSDVESSQQEEGEEEYQEDQEGGEEYEDEEDEEQLEEQGENRIEEVEEQGESSEKQVKQELKVKDPSHVPTMGKFFMHDDRGSERAAKEYGNESNQQLWEEDEGMWLHDKFETMDLGEAQRADSSRRELRGRGRGRRSERGSTVERGRGGRRGQRGKEPRERLQYRRVEAKQDEVKESSNTREYSIKKRGPSLVYKPKQKIEYRPKQSTSIPTEAVQKLEISSATKPETSTISQPKTSQKRYSSQREALGKKYQPPSDSSTSQPTGANKPLPINSNAANALPFTPSNSQKSASTFVPKKTGTSYSPVPVVSQINPPAPGEEQAVLAQEQFVMTPGTIPYDPSLMGYSMMPGVPYIPPNFQYGYQYPQFYPMLPMSNVNQGFQYYVPSYGYDPQLYNRQYKPKNQQYVKKGTPTDSNLGTQPQQWLPREKRSHAVPIVKPPEETFPKSEIQAGLPSESQPKENGETKEPTKDGQSSTSVKTE